MKKFILFFTMVNFINLISMDEDDFEMIDREIQVIEDELDDLDLFPIDTLRRSVQVSRLLFRELRKKRLQDLKKIDDQKRAKQRRAISKRKE